MKNTTIDRPQTLILADGIGKYQALSLLMPGHRPLNRRRRPWRWAFFVLGFILGWLAHGFA